MLAQACASRGYELHLTDRPSARSGLALIWGWDIPYAVRRASVRSLAEVGVIPRIISKWRQFVVLREAGLPVPRAAVALELPQALATATEIGFPVVIKPLYGSYSRGVELLRSAAELELA
jgi:glutathione synthase/RimK-type ligase-like ATP-grasp enzyme